MNDFITKDSGKRKQFSTGMQRDLSEDKPRFDLIFPECIPYKDQLFTRLANLMARGAKKYNERNREKAETLEEFNRFRESALRHFLQWYHGELDEDHGAAVIFNIQGAEMVNFKLYKDKNEEKRI